MHILYYNINNRHSISHSGRIPYIRKTILVKIWTDTNVSKHILFRGRLQFIIPMIDLCFHNEIYMSLIKSMYKSHIIDLARSNTSAICKYGPVTQCYDPRMFGVCHARSGDYCVHEINVMDNSICSYCRQPFPSLIPPIVCGRLIWHLS